MSEGKLLQQNSHGSKLLSVRQWHNAQLGHKLSNQIMH